MEITVMNKKRYDELLAKIKFLEDCVAFTQNETISIKNLETQIAFANAQIAAMQNSNNELAEIAFDESRFTDKLLEKVDDLARESARDTIDIDDIASEVANNMDISEEVQRSVERLDLVSEDKVNDLIQDFVDNEDLVSESKAEQLIEDYIADNCDFIERDAAKEMIEDAVHRLIGESLAGYTEHIVQLIANKLTAKENDHATGTHDYSLQVSGTSANSEGSSDAAAAA